MCRQTIVAGHDRTHVTHMTSQCQRLHAEDPHKVKPAKIQVWMGERLIKSHPKLRSSWQLMAENGYGRMSAFFRDAA